MHIRHINVLICTCTYACQYVSVISAANSGGRLGWAIFSDWAGRKNLFYVFGALGVPLAAAVPSITQWVRRGVLVCVLSAR